MNKDHKPDNKKTKNNKAENDKVEKERRSYNLLWSFNNALSGIIYAIRTERNMKIHVTASVVVLVLGLVLQVSKVEFLILCFAIGLVFVAELINTAVENIVDCFTPQYHQKAKVIKDMAAAGVFVAALFSLAAAYFIFYDKLTESLDRGISTLRRMPLHTTGIAIAVTMILVVTIKAFGKKGTPLSGGMPSGHSAIAFSLVTAIAFWSDNISIAFLSLIIALLLVQSRLEARIHNVYEVVAGGFLGFLITLIFFKLFYF